MPSWRSSKKLCCACAIFIFIFCGAFFHLQEDQSSRLNPSSQGVQSDAFDVFENGRQTEEQQRPDNPLEERDWHDYEAIYKDLARPPGLGEFGEAVSLSEAGLSPREVAEGLKTSGINVALSSKISPQRALADVRHKKCWKLTYLKRLPKTSIIIVAYNEERSVLRRTLYSILNRTPAELLEEILLVIDHSEEESSGNLFDEQDAAQFDGRVLKILHTPERLGLIKARLMGARQARGELLVFLDAHVEATHNWLPPLLDPIVRDPKTCTTPVIDTIHFENFAYLPATPARGGLNWQFNYVQLPLLPHEKKNAPLPHDNPIMNGGLFAISAAYFWHLGAYDEGLEIWGGEQFELSLKIWMCGGRLLEVPCSRFGHLYRSPNFTVKYTNRTDDFITKNFHRVAEVWMDSHKEIFYERIPKMNVTAMGSGLEERKALRRRLKCRSFKWFLETIVPDFVRFYPLVEPPDYASGALQSLAAPDLCLDIPNSKLKHRIISALRPCSPDLRRPKASQNWKLSFRRDLRNSYGDCLEVRSEARSQAIYLYPCHLRGGNQFWFYDQRSQLLVQINGASHLCLQADIVKRRVCMKDCDFVKPTMKWRFGYVNRTAMDGFFKDLKPSK